MSPVERREPAKKPSLWWQQQGTTERQGGDPKKNTLHMQKARPLPAPHGTPSTVRRFHTSLCRVRQHDASGEANLQPAASSLQ